MTTTYDQQTDAQWQKIVDEAARFYLGMSGAEFLAQLEAGKFHWDEGSEPDGLMAVMALVA